MNDVHKIAARKLRSLAAAIRAEAYAPHEFGVREAMEAEAVELERRAAVLAPQPVVDREALARILWLGRHLNSRPAQEAWPELTSDMKDTYLAMADAVLALINGTAK